MDESKVPLVSVIIPTHNRSEELSICLKSVLKQTMHNLEVFVLDDASTEDIQAVLNMFADRRIVYFRKDEKSNANVMRNIGITNAKGQFVAFLDSDDEWLPDHLEKKIACIEQHGIDMVFGSAFVDNGRDRIFAVSRELMASEHPVNYVLGNGFAQTSSWVMKSTCALEVRFDETLYRHQDYDFFIRFATRFKVKASWEPTSIIHWRKGVARLKNFESEKRFLSRYEKHLERRVLCQYCYTRFHQWKKLQNHAAMSFYRGLMLSQIDFITFNQFNQLQRAQGKWLFPLRWLHFSSLLLIKHFLKKA